MNAACMLLWACLSSVDSFVYMGKGGEVLKSERLVRNQIHKHVIHEPNMLVAEPECASPDTGTSEVQCVSGWPPPTNSNI